jgi:hypothetical protein
MFFRVWNADWEGKWKLYQDAADHIPDSELSNTVKFLKEGFDKSLKGTRDLFYEFAEPYLTYQNTVTELWQEADRLLGIYWAQHGYLRPAPTGDPQYSAQTGASGSSSNQGGSSHGKSGMSHGKSSGHKSSSSKSHGKGSSSRGKHK